MNSLSKSATYLNSWLGCLSVAASEDRPSQLRLNVLAGSGQALVAILLSALSYRVYLSYLGYEMYGLWLSLSVVLTIAQFGNAGLGPAITKLVAEAHGRKDVIAIRECVSTAFIALAVSGGVLALAVIVFRVPFVTALKLSPALTKQAVWILPWLAFLSAYVLQIEAMTAALWGLGRMDLASTLQALSRAIILVLSMLLLLAGKGITSLLVATSIGYALLHLATVITMYHLTGLNCVSVNAFKSRRLHDLLYLGSGMFACSLLNIFLAPFNKLVLTRFGGIALVPVYELAWVLTMQLRSIIDSGLRAILPEMSFLQVSRAGESRRRITLLYRKSVTVSVFAPLGIFAASALLAPPLLKLWLGQQFNPLLPSTLHMFFVGAFFSAASLPSYYTLLAHGKISSLVLGHAIQAAANVAVITSAVVLGYPLSPVLIAMAVTTGMCAAACYSIWRGWQYGVPSSTSTTENAALPVC